MPITEHDRACLWDMLTYARRVVILTQSIQFVKYEENWALQMATERALEVIGEAARRVSVEFRHANNQIPWSLIIGQRNILAHEYGEVRCERIWETATADVPRLVQDLERLLPGD